MRFNCLPAPALLRAPSLKLWRKRLKLREGAAGRLKIVKIVWTYPY